MKDIIKLSVVNVFSKGKTDCEHDWIYNKPTSMSFSVPPTVIQERICECCGRDEKVIIEGNQKRYDVEKFTSTKKDFSQQ